VCDQSMAMDGHGVRRVRIRERKGLIRHVIVYSLYPFLIAVAIMTRVTRSRAAKQVQDPTLGDDTANTVEDEVDEAEYRPRMKRARRSTGQAEGDGGEAPPAVPRKRTKGKLARLQDTPLDILFMVCARARSYRALPVDRSALPRSSLLSTLTISYAYHGRPRPSDG
jgi:hypothetical protein